MMRILGALMIFAACLYTACIKIKSLYVRQKSLEAMEECLVHMRNEISYRNDAIPELVSRLSTQLPGQAGMFMAKLCNLSSKIGETSFSNIWNMAVKSSFAELEATEYSEISKMGQSLGRCDAQSQIKAIEHCGKVLSAELERLSADLPQKRKLLLGLSATAGAFVVILLI